MSENPFAGATQDPIAMLEQLIRQVGSLAKGQEELRQELKGEIASVRQEMAGMRQELKQDIADVRQELKQDIADLRQELKGDIGRVEGEVRALRSDLGEVRRDFVRLTATVSTEQETFKAAVEASIERKAFAARTDARTNYAELEERVALLEEAERRRKAGEGA